MEKRLNIFIKFFVILLGLFVGFFVNQSFATTLYVDGGWYGGIYSDRNSLTSSMYKYTFKNSWYGYSDYGTFYGNYGWLGYSLYYNGVTKYDISNQLFQDRSCNTYSGLVLNSSIYGFSGYDQQCFGAWMNVAHFTRYYLYNYKSMVSPKMEILFGKGDQYGKVFIGLQIAEDHIPVYGFGNGFATSSNYISAFDTDTTYLRLFSNGRYTSGLVAFDDYDPITMSGNSYMYSSGITEREYFYPRGTRTNYGYIVDDGNNYIKYKHFGLYDMGYSYIYGRGLTDESTSISWNQLRFVTVEDNIEEALKVDGDISYSVFQNYSYPGFLVLKGTSYSSMGNDRGAYILSKDPNSPKHILYEHWSCNFSSLRTIFSGGNHLQSCIKLDGGYLTLNGSIDVLPFDDFTTAFSFTDSNNTFLYDLINGTDGLGNVHGETEIVNGKIYFNGRPTGYGFISNENVDLQELYLNGGSNTSFVSQLDSGFLSKCRTDRNFYISNIFLCNAGLKTIGQPTQIISGYYSSYGVDESGNIVLWVTYQEDFFNSGYVFVNDGTGSYYVCSNPAGCDNTPFFSSGVNIFSTGIDSLKDYFRDRFENGFWFSCPFPYGYGDMKEVATLGTKFFYGSIGRDFLYPLYCMGAGFKAGKSISYFSGVENVFDGRLFSSDNYNSLYHFFDIILSIGILFMIIKIYHLLN